MDVIIGAGISGLSYASYTKNDYIILESEAEPGGYCRTIKKNGFVWDYSGHFFHFQNTDIKNYICENIPKENLIDVKKHTQIYYNGLYIDFPFQKNIYQLPKDEFIDSLIDAYLADQQKKESFTFKDMVLNNLGKSIAEKFLIPYNEKLYACDLDSLDKEAMGRFFPKTNFEEILLNSKRKNNSSYNSSFTYPKGGAEEYVNSILSKIDGKRLFLNEKVEKIDIEQKIVYTNKRFIKYDNLISTIPFPKLLDVVNISYSKADFSSNKVLVLNLGFDKDSIDKKNSWVYFPNKDIIFYRLGYYNNIIRSDRMSLYIEIGLSENETVLDTSYYINRTLEDLKSVGIITDHILIDYSVILMNPAYVHITGKSEVLVKNIKKDLEDNSVYSIGRYGSWTYCSIEDNIIEALSLSKKISKNKSNNNI